MSSAVIGEFNMSVTVVNLDGLTARLERGGKAARQAILDAVGESAARLEQRTIDLCPKASGYMSEHVRTDFSNAGFIFETGWDQSDFLGTTDEQGHPRSFYPFFVEFGTKHMAAQPSLSIAYAEEQPRYMAALDKALADALNNV